MSRLLEFRLLAFSFLVTSAGFEDALERVAPGRGVFKYLRRNRGLLQF